ncbi:MAG TPA: monooxygenase, partial [Mycobacterium sp.]
LVRQIPALEVERDVFERYNSELDEALAQCIWSHKGMTTYYRNDAGRVVVSSPWTYIDYWRRTREFDMDDYHEVVVEPDAAELAM